ncbi:MAG: hypothetical protein Q4F00_12110 [bacterium]|nr:hypothetical protein [bacterium]
MPPAKDTKTDTVISLTDRGFSQIAALYEKQRLKLGGGRLQIGSYLCGSYFRALCSAVTPAQLPESYDLVLPVLAQRDLSLLEDSKAQDLISGARALVVNDPGMLRRFGSGAQVRLGRLFFRAYRDHRYPQYEESASGEESMRALVKALRELGYHFYAVEREAIGSTLPSPEDGVPVPYYHLPYRLISGMRICEYASAEKAIEKKFRPDAACRLQCLRYHIRYEDKAFANAYIKFGRGLYDLAPRDAARGTNLIITPELSEDLQK